MPITMACQGLWWRWQWCRKKNKRETRHMRCLLKVCKECTQQQELSLITQWRHFAHLCSSKSGVVAKSPFSPTLIITIRLPLQAYSTELVRRIISSRRMMKAYLLTKSTRCKLKLQALATNNHFNKTGSTRHQIVFKWTDIKEMSNPQW